jgi:ribonuclease HI
MKSFAKQNFENDRYIKYFKLVQKSNQVLIRLGRNNRVVVDWVPSYSGIPRNERADSLAQDVVSMLRNGFSERLLGATLSIRWIVDNPFQFLF